MLITLESDKAATDIPSPQAGVVSELQAKVGDRISEGGLILRLETAHDVTSAARPLASLSPARFFQRGDSGDETVLALEMGADAEDMALTIHPHPTLSETIFLQLKSRTPAFRPDAA